MIRMYYNLQTGHTSYKSEFKQIIVTSIQIRNHQIADVKHLNSLSKSIKKIQIKTSILN